MSLTPFRLSADDLYMSQVSRMALRLRSLLIYLLKAYIVIDTVGKFILFRKLERTTRRCSDDCSPRQNKHANGRHACARNLAISNRTRLQTFPQHTGPVDT